MVATSKPLAGLRFALAGPGRVGVSVASWLVAAGAQLTTVAGRAEPAAEGHRGLAACQGLGGRAVSLSSLATSEEDLLLLAVPAGALAAVDGMLSRRANAVVALHTAGSVGAEALPALAAGGCHVGALHPLKAFPRPLPAPTEATGMVMAIDGDAAALALAERLAGALSARPVVVPAGQRLLYHFAATLAAGGVVTTLGMAIALGRAVSLPAAVEAGYLELARGALAAVPPTAQGGVEPSAAITGPLARGEREYLAQALDALLATAPELGVPATTTALETLRQLAAAGRSPATAAALGDDLRRRQATPSGPPR